MQELVKFNFKINVVAKRLVKHMSFNINNKLTFINNFQFLGSSLDSLVKDLCKNDFKYLSQEFDNKVLYLVKQKGFYPYEYMSVFARFKEKLLRKEEFYSSLTDKKSSNTAYVHALNVWNKIEIKTMENVMFYC